MFRWFRRRRYCGGTIRPYELKPDETLVWIDESHLFDEEYFYDAVNRIYIKRTNDDG